MCQVHVHVYTLCTIILFVSSVYTVCTVLACTCMYMYMYICFHSALGDTVSFSHVDLPKGTFVRLQPVSSAWLV